jgi:hypothetical protein
MNAGNILKLGDFGISRLLGPSTELARTAVSVSGVLAQEQQQQLLQQHLH